MTKTSEETLWTLVEDVTFCMFVTWDGQQLRSRPMTLKSDEAAGEFQFLSAPDSSTIEAIRKNPLVNLAFAEPEDQDYVSVSGYATVSHDRALIAALWSPYATRYFGGDPGSANVAAIRVVPHEAEYWDGESHKAKAAWNLLKARMGDGKPPMAEHAKVTFRP
jgi:general stress protein 26